jgi:hypothetical protein
VSRIGVYCFVVVVLLCFTRLKVAFCVINHPNQSKSIKLRNLNNEMMVGEDKTCIFCGMRKSSVV